VEGWEKREDEGKEADGKRKKVEGVGGEALWRGRRPPLWILDTPLIIIIFVNSWFE